MAAFILAAVVMLSVAVLAGTGTPVERINVDRIAPPLPENVADYEASGRAVGPGQ